MSESKTFSSNHPTSLPTNTPAPSSCFSAFSALLFSASIASLLPARGPKRLSLLLAILLLAACSPCVFPNPQGLAWPQGAFVQALEKEGEKKEELQKEGARTQEGTSTQEEEKAKFEGEIRQLQEQRESIGKQRKWVESQIEDLITSKNEVNSKFEWLLDRSKEEQELYMQRQTELDGLLGIMQTLNLNVQILAEQYEAKRLQYSERLAQMFLHQKKSLLEVFLESKSLGGFLSTVKFMQIVAKADEQALKDLEESKKNLEDQKNATNAQIQTLEKQMERIKAEMSSIERGIFDIRRRYDRLDQQIRTRSRQLSQYSSRSREITDAIEEAERRKNLAEQKAALLAEKMMEKKLGRKLSGKAALDYDFIWPLPNHYEITSTFGYRDVPELNLHDFHTGLDIAANHGEPIVSAEEGVVSFVGQLPYGNNTVKIQHGQGVATMFCHLSGFNCEVGQQVKAGDVIAYVGSTGLATGPHLHFEIQIDGVPVDPELYLYQ